MLTTLLDLLHGPLKPEIMLVTAALGLLMIGAFERHEDGRTIGWLALLFLALAGFLIAFPCSVFLFFNVVRDDARQTLPLQPHRRAIIPE